MTLKQLKCVMDIIKYDGFGDDTKIKIYPKNNTTIFLMEDDFEIKRIVVGNLIQITTKNGKVPPEITRKHNF